MICNQPGCECTWECPHSESMCAECRRALADKRLAFIKGIHGTREDRTLTGHTLVEHQDIDWLIAEVEKLKAEGESMRKRLLKLALIVGGK